MEQKETDNLRKGYQPQERPPADGGVQGGYQPSRSETQTPPDPPPKDP